MILIESYLLKIFMFHRIMLFVVYRLLLLVLFAYENIVTVIQLDNEMLQPFQICALVMPGSCFHEIWKLLSSVTDLLIIADSKIQIIFAADAQQNKRVTRKVNIKTHFDFFIIQRKLTSFEASDENTFVTHFP